MSTLRLLRICRPYTFRKVCVCYSPLAIRYVYVSAVYKKHPKETVAAIIQMRKENLQLFGRLLKTSKKTSQSEEKQLEDKSDELKQSENTPKRKRGRPKKIKPDVLFDDDSTQPSNAETSDTNQSKQTNTSQTREEVSSAEEKKHGRPKKTKTTPDAVSEVQSTEPKKRGRPKKVKPSDALQSEEELESGRNTLVDESHKSTQTKTFQELQATGADLEKETDEVRYVINPEEETLISLPSLTALLTFPFFHPTKREYFVSVPKVPDIYIPGYSERATSDNPFFPSVGTILSTTQPPESRMMLKRWRDNLVKELGEQGFQKYQKDLLVRGSNFHQVIEQYLKGDSEPESQLKEENSGYWQSAQIVLRDITDVQSVEEVVLHRNLCYKGQFDCIASYRDKRMLIDWKTSKKPRSTIQQTYDNPLQVAAYLGAYNYSPDRKMVDNAMIVVCYEDGQPADSHVMTRSMCIDYWTKWLQRLNTFWMNKFKVNT